MIKNLKFCYENLKGVDLLQIYQSFYCLCGFDMIQCQVGCFMDYFVFGFQIFFQVDDGCDVIGICFGQRYDGYCLYVDVIVG